MDRLFQGIVRKRKWILWFVAALTVLSMPIANLVSVNYSFRDYLPANTEGVVALSVMQEQYASGAPNVRVMARDVTIPTALRMKDALTRIDGVQSVIWLDDIADVYAPLHTLPSDAVQSYYKDSSALMIATVENEKLLTALKEARAQLETIAGKPVYMDGEGVNSAVATGTMEGEIAGIMLIALPLCFLILLLTTDSFMEPVLFMIAIGAAVLINRGSNVIFGEISFVTNAASSILQLAVSMDYSIFLLHRFSEFRRQGLSNPDAMTRALKSSVSSIAASGLTTVIGFLALALMEFRIGPDMGLVMAKGILLSILSVFLLLPALTLACGQWIDKTKHKPLLPPMTKVGKAVMALRAPALALFFLLIIPVYLGQQANTFTYGASDMFAENTPAYQERKAIEDVYGKSNQMVLLVPRGDFAMEKELSKELQALPEVTSMLSWVDAAGAEIPTEYVDEATRAQLLSKDYSRMVFTVKTATEGEQAMQTVQTVREIAAKHAEGCHLVGESVIVYDMRQVVHKDMRRVNIIAVIAIFITLIITTRSLITPVALVSVIEVSIWLNLSIPYFFASGIHYIAYLIINAMQLGATVDYAILWATRYTEERKRLAPRAAVDDTMRHSMLSILTSASILTIAGYSLQFVCTNTVISQIGSMIARGALFSAAGVLLVLPAIMVSLDKPLRAMDAVIARIMKGGVRR